MITNYQNASLKTINMMKAFWQVISDANPVQVAYPHMWSAHATFFKIFSLPTEHLN